MQGMRAASRDVTAEVSNYLAEASSNLSFDDWCISSHQIALRSTKCFLASLVLSINSAPAYAAADRLFSLGGGAFSPVSSNLSSGHLKMMVFEAIFIVRVSHKYRILYSFF